MEHLKALVRDVPDFPTAGILFRDITPLLGDAAALAEVADGLAAPFRGRGVDLVVGIESRGFIFGAPLALALDAGFVPVRKPGRLPARTVGREYALEYGSNRLEMHVDAVRTGQRVLLVDDVLATGGTAQASADLVEELGGELVAAAFVVELSALGGRGRLAGREVHALLRY